MKTNAYFDSVFSVVERSVTVRMTKAARPKPILIEDIPIGALFYYKSKDTRTGKPSVEIMRVAARDEHGTRVVQGNRVDCYLRTPESPSDRPKFYLVTDELSEYPRSVASL